MVQMSGPTTIVLLLAVWGLGGCGTAEPVRQDRYYSLDPVAPVVAGGEPVPAIVQVNDLAARGFLGGRQIVFRTREAPEVVSRYGELLWEDPPTKAVARALVRALRAAGVFRFVVIPSDRARADFLLGGEVERFEHRPTDQPPRVVATISLALVRADDRSSMANRQYSGEEPVDGDTPQAMARAFDRLTARLVAEVVRDIRAARPRLAVRRRSGPG